MQSRPLLVIKHGHKLKSCSVKLACQTLVIILVSLFLLFPSVILTHFRHYSSATFAQSLDSYTHTEEGSSYISTSRTPGQCQPANQLPHLPFSLLFVIHLRNPSDLLDRTVRTTLVGLRPRLCPGVFLYQPEPMKFWRFYLHLQLTWLLELGLEPSPTDVDGCSTHIHRRPVISRRAYRTSGSSGFLLAHILPTSGQPKAKDCASDAL